MGGAGRLLDYGQAQSDAHGCPLCPHPMVTGPAILGSFDVIINGRPALRQHDIGIHAACCAMNMWTATKGAPHVNINGRPAHRMNDQQQHCGGVGKLVVGSANVIIGDGGGGGGGGAGGSGGTAAQQHQAPPAGTPVQQPAESRAVPPSKEALKTATPPAAQPEPEPTPKPDSWIEIELVDQDGDPVPDEPYEIVASDGTKRTGRLNRQGQARENWLAAGDCVVTFPHLKGWKPS